MKRYHSDTTNADGFTSITFDSVEDFTFKFALTYTESDKWAKQISVLE